MQKDIRIERLDKMEKYILEMGTVDFRQLTSYFDISLNTLRYDIAELSVRGNIIKVYGGARSLVSRSVKSVNERRYQNYGIKMRIGEVAGSFVEDGLSIYIDAGTTAECMIPFLSKVQNVNLTTHCLGVMEHASAFPNLIITGIGGKYDILTRSFMDQKGMDLLSKTRFDYVFVGATSVKSDGIYSDLYLANRMKECIVNSGDKVVVLTDSSKFLRSAAPFRACGFDKIDVLITDKVPPAKIKESIEKYNIDLYLA